MKGASTAMYKMILTEVIAPGKGKEDRAYREKSQRVFDRFGIPHKVWRIEGRKRGQVLVELGPFDSREAFETAGDKLSADEEWQDLQRQRIASGTVVPATCEAFILID
jgi:hypothetical protein